MATVGGYRQNGGEMIRGHFVLGCIALAGVSLGTAGLSGSSAAAQSSAVVMRVEQSETVQVPEFDPGALGIASSQYGGGYIDSMGREVINLVGPIPDSLIRLLSGSGYTVARVRFSLDELNEVRSDLTSQFQSLNEAGFGVVSAGLDIPRNMVIVGVKSTDDLDEIGAFPLLEGFHRSGIAEFEATGMFEPLSGTRSDDRSPWWGGASWWPSGSRCTSNFVFYRQYSDGSKAYRIVTAGHCNRSGAVVTTAGSTVGTSKVVGYANYATADSMHVVPTGATTNRIYVSSTASLAVTGWNNDPPADATYQYCFSGASSGSYCAMRLYLKNQNIYHSDTGITILDQDVYQQKAAVAVPGDSGAPIYLRKSDGTVSARGLVSGYYSSNRTLIAASTIGNIRATQGLTGVRTVP